MKLKHQIPKINFLLLIFLLSLLKSFKISKTETSLTLDVILLVILFAAIVINLILLPLLKKGEHSIKKLSVIFWIISFTILLISGFYRNRISGLGSVLILYGPFFLISLFAYIKVMINGIGYLKQFFRQFLIIMNVFSVLNVYEVIYRKPLLLNLINEKMYSYQAWSIGTADYRTISVFGNPILCGLFFVIAFICNMYILKSGTWKIILQSFLLLNILSTDSRSAWLCLLFVLFLIFVRKFPDFKIKKIKITQKKLIPYFFSFCAILTVLFFFSISFFEIIDTIVRRFGDSLSSGSSDISNVQRLGTVILILNNFLIDSTSHQLFGYGIYTVQSFMLNNFVAIENFGTTDNQYMTWLYEFGILGLIFIFVFFMSLLLNKPILKIQYVSYYLLITVLGAIFFFEGISRTWTAVSVILGILVVVLSIREKDYNRSD